MYTADQADYEKPDLVPVFLCVKEFDVALEFVPTNEAFKKLILILRIHKDKEFMMQLFKDGGYNQPVSKAKLKAWQISTGDYNRDFRPMPRSAYDAFIRGLEKAKIIDDDWVD